MRFLAFSFSSASFFFWAWTASSMFLIWTSSSSMRFYLSMLNFYYFLSICLSNVVRIISCYAYAFCFNHALSPISTSGVKPVAYGAFSTDLYFSLNSAYNKMLMVKSINLHSHWFACRFLLGASPTSQSSTA